MGLGANITPLMFLDAGFYFDVMEITPEAVGVHRFNRDNQKVVIIWLMSQTLKGCCQLFAIIFFSFCLKHFPVSFIDASPWNDFHKEIFGLQLESIYRAMSELELIWYFFHNILSLLENVDLLKPTLFLRQD